MNKPPVANAGPDQTVQVNKRTGQASFTLDGSGSSDPDGTIASYAWTVGSTSVGSGPTLRLQRPAGVYTFTLKVTDNGGLTDTDTVVVTVTSGRGGHH